MPEGSQAASATVAAVRLGADPLTIEDVVAVARRNAPVALDPAVEPRLRAARQAVERAAASGARIYGLTTGLGAAVDTTLPEGEIVSFQRRAVQARAVAVGERLARDEVRATLLVRLAGLAQGASGISPDIPAALGDMLNRGVHPLARRTGSLGEADLAPLAGLFLAFAGEGQAELDGDIMPAPLACAKAGITLPHLHAKDGIALINANSFSVATGALLLHDTCLALEAGMLAGALSLEAFRANLSVIDPRVVALRAAPGQAELSARLRQVLAGSDLLEPGRARRVQDPLSLRCLAPVLGVAFNRLAGAREAIEADLAGAGDSPAVLPGSGEMLSSVNFDTTAIALGFEALGQALAHAGALATFRICKLMSADLSGLPRFLASRGGSRSGFATAQKTAAALQAEICHLALPVGPMTAPVADGVEDYAPMTPRVVGKTRALVEHFTILTAIELVVAAAAADQRSDVRLGQGTVMARRAVRDRVSSFDDDRSTGEDFMVVAAAIREGAFADAATS